jgi:hypothetical protein
MTLAILYRGALSSCNYDCGYCPFAKRQDDRATLDLDRHQLERFVAWAESFAGDRLGVLFTPWGEALVRAWYREAITRLSRMAHLERVAIQTNLSAPLGVLDDCDLSRVALWCTYHPGEVTRSRFLRRCGELLRRGVRFSVGIVGMREHLTEIEAIRSELPPTVYVWVNAVRREMPRYAASEIARLRAVDPHFDHSLSPRPSRGAPCRAGESAISVDGEGTVRRCHFVPEVIGNLYEPGWERALAPRACPNRTCTCHIGYVQRKDLELHALFEGGILERIPGAQVSTTGAYAAGSSKPAIQAAACRQVATVGGTRST